MVEETWAAEEEAALEAGRGLRNSRRRQGFQSQLGSKRSNNNRSGISVPSLIMQNKSLGT